VHHAALPELCGQAGEWQDRQAVDRRGTGDPHQDRPQAHRQAHRPHCRRDELPQPVILRQVLQAHDRHAPQPLPPLTQILIRHHQPNHIRPIPGHAQNRHRFDITTPRRSLDRKRPTERRGHPQQHHLLYQRRLPLPLDGTLIETHNNDYFNLETLCISCRKLPILPDHSNSDDEMIIL